MTLACNEDKTTKNKKIILVSILPLKNFVEKIAGNNFKVQVMIPKGYNSVTYDPTPKKLMTITKASLYFQIGLPAEKRWHLKIKQDHPTLKIINLKQNIVLRKMDPLFIKKNPNTHHTPHTHKHHHASYDPHIWLSPTIAEALTKTIYNHLCEINPKNQQLYYENLNRFLETLKQLKKKIRSKLQATKLKEIIVFHPSWGYFADEFNFKQIPIQVEGKESSAKNLTLVLNFIASKGIKTIFTQKQFDQRFAKTIAKEIKGNIITLDPLAEDYTKNLWKTTLSFTKSK